MAVRLQGWLIIDRGIAYYSRAESGGAETSSGRYIGVVLDVGRGGVARVHLRSLRCSDVREMEEIT